MKHSIKKQSDTQTLVTVTVDASDLTTIKQKTVARLSKSLKVAGFRPGKVPADDERSG